MCWQTKNSQNVTLSSSCLLRKVLKYVERLFLSFVFKQIVCSSCAEWRVQRAVRLQGPRQCHGKMWKSPQVNCRSQPGSPGTGSTVPSHQGDTRRGQSCSDGWVIMNSCRGPQINGGYQANVSTRSPLALRVSQWKSLLRG